MCGPPARLITLKAEISELPALERWVASLAADFALPPQLAFRTDLCLTETVANLIAHGYPDGSAGSFTAGIWKGSDAIVIHIEDDGIAFDPTRYQPAPLPHSLAEATIGGRGIRLMRQYTDQIRYERRGRVNSLALLFRNPGDGLARPGTDSGAPALPLVCPDLACL